VLGPSIRNKPYMRVDISKFVGGNTSFQSLARSILINPQFLLTSILAPPESKLGQLNAQAVLAIARQEGTRVRSPRAPSCCAWRTTREWTTRSCPNSRRPS
jgi:hypothetical protein